MTGYSVELVSIDRAELNERSVATLAHGLEINLEDASQIVDQFEYAELGGKMTHGYVRVPWLVQQGLHGHEPVDMNLAAQEGPVRVNCSSAIGYLAANEIVKQLQSMSDDDGTRVIIAEDIFPTNTLGFYMRNMVQDEGRMGVLFGTTPKLAGTSREAGRIMGTNPLSIGFRQGETALVTDITTARSSLGELLVARYWGDFRSDNFRTASGEVPSSMGQLFADGKFSGSIDQTLNERSEQRLYALSIAIQGVASIIAPRTDNRGNLIFISTSDVAFGTDATADGGYLLPGIEPNDLPGVRSHNRYLDAREKDSITIPSELWREIVDLSDNIE